MGKKTILLVIDNLVKGGAEVLLVGILPELNLRYNVVLVTLKEKTEFPKEEIIYRAKYSLGFKNKWSLIRCIYKLRKIIREHRPDLVHSHLIYSSLVARMACPSSIPLLYSIHGELSKSDFNNSKGLTFLEKNTIKKNHSLIAVSNIVLKDYETIIATVPNSFVLYNYISDEFFTNPIDLKSNKLIPPLKMVAVGNIKAAKNYDYLLNAFALLKNDPVTLDIYGNTNHPLYQELISKVESLSLKVTFKGAANIVREKLIDYDLFIMSSKHEGFGISVIEAMAFGLPLFLSDIPVLREITQENAVFFNLNNPQDLANKIKGVLEGKQNLSQLSAKGRHFAKKYCKKDYTEKLFTIYDQQISQPYNS